MSPEAITAIGGLILALTGLVTAVTVLIGRLRGAKKLNSVMVGEMGKVLAASDDAEDIKESISTTASMEGVEHILKGLIDEARKAGKV